MSTIRIGSVLTFWLSIVCCRSFVPQKARCRSSIIGAIVDMNSPDQTNEWNVPKNGFSGKIWEERPKAHLTTSSNATLPIAMMVLDPSLFPSRSMAIRAIRKKDIIVKRDQIEIKGKTDTRVFPSDIILRRNSHRSDGYQGLSYGKPIVPLPVVYEDDQMAVVNKPSGMICHSLSKGGFNNNSVLRVAPHVLQPPMKGTESALEYPVLVHRLDSLTSGLLVLAKTKKASIHLADQFEQRKVHKTYTALLEGEPSHGERIEYPIEGKPSITIWKLLRTVQTTKGILSLVELNPQSGRKHQLRKHVSEVLGCPIVGDELYGSTIGRSLFLCAHSISIQHPLDGGWVQHSIDLPKRFDEYIAREEKRYIKYQEYMKREGSQPV